MKNKSINLNQLAVSVRKPLPPPTKPFKDKRRSIKNGKDWKREEW